jgi:hypothetical protein
MTDKLFDFVNELDKSPELQEKYEQDPQGTMTAFGVSDDDVKLISTGNMEEIKKRMDMSGLKAIVRISHSK